MKTNKSIEDYLEAIFLFEQKGEKILSVRIAEHLGVSRPAVNQMVNELISQGYLEKPMYGKISLTEAGRKIAKDTYKRHRLIKDFFVSLGVSEETAEIDCCKVEHVLSSETLKVIKNYLKK